jgi:hypothetical protein|tara:strand:+ start:724 stop:1458 length:735 start_codon:yes stop_codon:yes gene_type:complete
MAKREKQADEEVMEPGEIGGSAYEEAQAQTEAPAPAALPEEVTNALTSLASGMDTLTQKVNALETQAAPVAAPEPQKVEDMSDPYSSVNFDGLFEDPGKTLRGLGEAIVGQVTQELDKRGAAMEGKRVEQDFWRDFYDGHPEFSRGDDHNLITSIANQHAGDLQTMTPEAFASKLGDWTKEEILRISKRSRGSSKQVAETPGLVTNLDEAQQREEPDAEDPHPKVHSMGDMIKQRRAARRSATK